MVCHFKTIQWKKRKKNLKSTPFKTPSQQRWKPCPSRWTPVTWMADPFSFMKPTHIRHPLHHHHHHLSGYTHPGCHHIHLLLFRSSRESSVEPHSEDSSPTGRKRHQSEPAFIRPHDIDRGLTPRLSALLQEMSPLAPYKLERSAKARARQAFSTMHWTPFKTLQRKSVNLVQIDSFQDPCTFVYVTQPLCIDSFQDPCDLSSKLTHFKTLGSYTALNCSNWLISRPLHSPWETTFKLTVLNLHGRLPSTKLVLSRQFHTVNPGLISRPLHHIIQCFHSPWETSLEKLDSFRTILHSEFRIPFKTPVTHTSHSVNGLLSRPFRRGKEHRAHSNTVLVTFWTHFKTPHQKSKKTQDMTTRHIIHHHHHHTIEGM